MTIDSKALDADETLVWSGRPNALSYALKKSWSTFLFGIFFFSMPAFAIYAAVSSPAASTSDLFAVLFVGFFAIIGFGMLLSPLWHFFHGLRTTYVLTNRRALITRPTRRLSVLLKQIGVIDMRPAENGSGDLYFAKTVVEDSEGKQEWREGFVAIPNVAQVEQLLRKTVERAAARSFGGAP